MRTVDTDRWMIFISERLDGFVYLSTFCGCFSCAGFDNIFGYRWMRTVDKNRWMIVISMSVWTPSFMMDGFVYLLSTCCGCVSCAGFWQHRHVESQGHTLWTKVKDEYIFHLLINVSVWMDMSIYLLSTLIVVFYRSDTKWLAHSVCVTKWTDEHWRMVMGAHWQTTNGGCVWATIPEGW